MSTAVATIERAPRSVLVDMSTRYGMEPAAFEATIRATVCKGSVSREEFAAFLLVAKEYRLNPLTKEIYAFPAKGGGIQPIVSIDGWSRIINDHPMFDGMEFVDQREGDALVAVTCRMYRKDRTRPIEATEYMSECKRNTDVWKQWPARMLRHKAMIQAARYSFGFSGIIEPDEYDRQMTPQPVAARRLHADFEEQAPEPPRALDAPLEATDATFEDAPAEDEPEAETADAEDSFPGDLPLGLKRGSDLLKNDPREE
ncbi:MAG: phage recombination protein Bet [Proteobacteria bacterium]|nr:phage recombination protein Bet [Pseudomonadota bacterium]